MPFKYSCFISYCHGQGKYIKQFVDRLHEELKNRVDFWLDEPIFLDEERIKPGYKFDETIAAAICASVCMIVVYVPKYRRKPYCLSELVAMQIVEEQRLAALGDALPPDRGMIVPVVLRGRHDDLPDWIKGRRHYCDLTAYATGSDDVFTSEECIRFIEDLAESINEIYEGFEQAQVDPASGCEPLPDPAKVEAMLGRSIGADGRLPGRGAVAAAADGS